MRYLYGRIWVPHFLKFYTTVFVMNLIRRSLHYLIPTVVTHLGVAILAPTMSGCSRRVGKGEGRGLSDGEPGHPSADFPEPAARVIVERDFVGLRLAGVDEVSPAHLRYGWVGTQEYRGLGSAPRAP